MEEKAHKTVSKDGFVECFVYQTACLELMTLGKDRAAVQ